MAENLYPGMRNYIRLRGQLLASDGTVLADRYVYAGNILSEKKTQRLAYG